MNKPLHPTLWRTCRVLSGRTRLRLLRHVLETPGLNVSQLAGLVGIGVSDASQELRRLQSRGLLKRTQSGPAVIYLPEADLQVAAAAPLLAALQAMWPGKTEIDEVIRIAKGLASERRIALFRALRQQPRTTVQLADHFRTVPAYLKQNLRVLREGGWTAKQDGRHTILPAATPLAAALLGQL